MFTPSEIIFSITTACNMHCPHCFVNRKPFTLKASDAITFLKSVYDSQNSSIEKVGFSGGEPFLRPDFLCEVIKAAIDMDFMFDRIMTNGDWWKTKEDLCATLQKVYDAGYDGKIGVSYDNFHAQSEERIATFIQTVWELFGSDAVEIQSVEGEVSPFASSKESATLSTGVGSDPTCGDKTCETGFERVSVKAVPEPCPPYPQESHTDSILLTQNLAWKLSSLASRLNLTYEENISPSGLGIASLSDDEHFLPAYIQTESFQSTDPRAWHDKTWFKDEHCAEMGQILFVHATGDIAPCCGFANENKALYIGKITDSLDTILKNASQSKMIKICYEEGLSKQIKLLKEQGKLPEGKTADVCTFCDLLCKL
ncbi:MAG: 4Fe-4S cluster-binding domain-containing protein [Treponema sp.]|uniref:radical SAM protein n=1 Tax=Treponema sp. TaxID=166 RepID=UPI002A90C7AD|nr:radical SAM protein [Treponema sp.]MDY6396953.1 4Fe-4S cluster-binding domain-containing protein [Treponema sp.]